MDYKLFAHWLGNPKNSFNVVLSFYTHRKNVNVSKAVRYWGKHFGKCYVDIKSFTLYARVLFCYYFTFSSLNATLTVEIQILCVKCIHIYYSLLKYERITIHMNLMLVKRYNDSQVCWLRVAWHIQNDIIIL